MLLLILLFLKRELPTDFGGKDLLLIQVYYIYFCYCRRRAEEKASIQWKYLSHLTTCVGHSLYFNCL